MLVCALLLNAFPTLAVMLVRAGAVGCTNTIHYVLVVMMESHFLEALDRFQSQSVSEVCK